jgi:polar amino acid transport system ATP-binding protein
MRGEVLTMIGELKAIGTQFVLVTHEMGFARRVADEVAFIADGTVAAHGPVDTILAGDAPPTVRRFLDRILA